MAGQQEAIYNSYVASTTKHNVKPVTFKGDSEVFEILRANGVDFDKPYSHSTRFWDNDARTRVFKFDDGRIAEYATTNSAMGTALLAVFETHDDWFNYRKPMGRFHYFNA
ncbi:MAG: hypothetical protein M9945_12475 [Aquamicrobium sp.]|uniref:hypothetical protein n=1 Tax=Aquamicrobium sp. TaxID=1872579 RepID=UPI00349E9FCA|nr:hypothetical protein [Aquamicrobium sp.]